MQQSDLVSAEDIVVDLVVSAARLTRLAGVISGDALPPHAELRALSVLDEHGELRVSEFARIDRCSQPAATALIGKLVADGYATRHKDPDDARAVVVTLTPAGRNRLTESRRAFGSALAARLPGYGTDRLNRLEAELTALLDALEATEAHRTN
ncbi:MarR family winged helix-turn-helix transcriptional regulator [Nocardia cyriacigeorgica]|uniref:MarR family winged helix-turn-helix transcriptional regulator n=1 Tax=Nocardia cyriacigeorgica TaxID=135487 RepID=UPI0024543992|nr:MarR family transcriptional regulator [Nocardia cyriacigeorgica]